VNAQPNQLFSGEPLVAALLLLADKARVNAMNALLCNYHGERRLLVAPQCRELIKDFERVCWTGDAHGNLLGNIDKSDPMRSHVSDALGYFVAQEFALLTNTPNIRQL